MPFTDYRCVPVVIDLDRDGAKDLVLGEWYSSVRFYRNVGADSAPLFTGYDTLVPADPDSFLNGNPPRVNFTDWDGDTDMDMITCDYYGSVFLRRNITQTGVEEWHEPQATGSRAQATLVKGVLRLTRGAGRTAPGVLLDASGRSVLDVHSGENDLSGLTPGVYFVAWGDKREMRRVVVVR
jgi:hypothetical protein